MLHTALANRQEKIAQLLIKHGADVNFKVNHVIKDEPCLRDEYGGSLTTALWYDMDNILPILLERGAEVNARGGKYGCALHTALASRREKFARLLIEHGADMNLQVSHLTGMNLG